MSSEQEMMQQQINLLVEQVQLMQEEKQQRANRMEERFDMLSGQIREALNLMPQTVRSELNDFIVALKEELSGEDSKMAESIAQLAKAMDSYRQEMKETNITTIQAAGTVMEVKEAITQLQRQLGTETESLNGQSQTIENPSVTSPAPSNGSDNGSS